MKNRCKENPCCGDQVDCEKSGSTASESWKASAISVMLENRRLKAEIEQLRSALCPLSDIPAQAGEVVPRLPNCGTYLAKDNKGNWHYLNHANSWCPYQGPDEQSQALLKDVLRVLDSYADPTSYLDSNGEYLPADAVLHDGLLAKDTAAKIRAALGDPSTPPVNAMGNKTGGEL